MALLPLLWLGGLAFHGYRRPVLWWALALVLSLSWVADTAAHWVNPWTVSAIYPSLQAVVLAGILLPLPQLRIVFPLLIGVLGFALLWGARPDILGRTAAWTAILVIAWPHREIRGPVLVTFGLGWVAWLGYHAAQNWLTWGLYQAVRALGLGVFCWATLPQRVRA